MLRKSGKDVTGEAALEALSTTLEDGLTTRPLYTSRDSAPPAGLPGFAPFTRGGGPAGNAAGGWDVRQRHLIADPARLNDALLADLENGVTSLWLGVGGPGGVPVAGLERALDGVLLDLAPLVLDSRRRRGARRRSWCGCTGSGASPRKPSAAASASTRWAGPPVRAPRPTSPPPSTGPRGARPGTRGCGR